MKKKKAPTEDLNPTICHGDNEDYGYNNQLVVEIMTHL